MAEPWQIQVFDRHQLVYSGRLEGPIELGRQGEASETLFRDRPAEGGRHRLVIAPRDEDSVSRRHALLEPADGGRVRLTNLSGKVPIRLADGAEVRPGTQAELTLPADLMLGRKLVRLHGPAAEDEEGVEYLREATVPPGSRAASPLSGATPTEPLPLTLAGGSVGDQEVETLVRWLRDAMDAFQAAAEPDDFFRTAARALVDSIGLDSGWVLARERGDWATAACRLPDSTRPGSESSWRPSRHVLEKVASERRTFWKAPALTASDAVSLVGVMSVVAAPILDRRGEVIGALYGDRRQRGAVGPPARTTRLDAMLVELLACAVASGLDAKAQERAAVAAKVQFEQFFTPELARVLAERPEMLKGQDAEITVLFCDIRGFSRISGRVDAARLVEWIGDVLGALSDCVRDHQGVLVDYIGDELMAMWGAPEARPDHAQLACRAALAMLGRLPELNERWCPALGEPMGLGIGVNTGPARVGNVGSRHKFKYGPLGNTVNLASRVQGVTKYLKSPLLVTRATRDRLGDGLPARRIGLVRVVNIDEPAELFELADGSQPDWDDRRLAYESALAEFEARQFRRATRILGNMLLDHPDDGPSIALLSRVVQCLVDERSFDPVFVPPGK